MSGNVYGVDIKSTPSLALADYGLNFAPTGIEINGINSGTNVFRYPDGFSYFLNFVRVLGKQAEGKPIFINSGDGRKLDPIERIVAEVGLRKENERTKTYQSGLSGIFGSNFEFDYGWLDDVLDIRVEQLSQDPKHRDSLYVTAALQEGVPLYVYRNVSFAQGRVQFTLTNGEIMRLKPTDIGVIRSGQATLRRVPEEYKYLFLNSTFIEDVLDSKPLFDYLSKYSLPNNRLRHLFPESMSFGYGVTDVSTLLEFLYEIPSQLVVKKRGTSSQGTGIEILEKQKLIETIESKYLDMIVPARRKHLIQAILQVIDDPTSGGIWGESLSLFQEFKPSIPIYNPITGKYHDGCARVMVYSPPEGEPIVLGSRWRLATNAMDDQDASLEDRLRVNLSRGATSCEIDPDQKGIIDAYAALIVSEFEDTINNFQAELARQRTGSEKDSIQATDIQMTRILLYGQNLMRGLVRLREDNPDIDRSDNRAIIEEEKVLLEQIDALSSEPVLIKP